MPAQKSARRRGVLLVLIATVMWSLPGLFARLARPSRSLDGHGLAGDARRRLDLGRRRRRMANAGGWKTRSASARLSPLVAALALIAISAYTAAVMTTTIADVMIIYATLPFVAAGIGWLVNREAVSQRTLVAGARGVRRHRRHGRRRRSGRGVCSGRRSRR